MEEPKLQSRRDFLKKLSLFAGSGLLMTAAPGITFSESLQNKESSANDRIRLGVIGVGSRGRYHVLVLNNIPNVEITAVCDNYPPNYDRAKELTNGKAEAYWDYRELLEKNKPDAVIIATPLHQHAHIAIDCLKAGIHVFCEKSMARTLEDTKAMYDTHRSTGQILQIGHQRLFNHVYLEGMQRIHNGELGQLGQLRAYWHRNNDWRRPVPEGRPDLEEFINWRLYKEYSAGLLTELMSHQLQVANWALQKTPVSVTGTGSIVFWKDGREVNDNVALIYSYEDGTQFIYDSMTSNKKYGLEEQIMGHKGTIEFEVNRYFSETPPPAPGILQLLNDIESGIFKDAHIGGSSWVPETAVTYQGEPIIKDTDFYDSALQLEGFVNHIRKGKAPERLTREGYNASIWTLLGEKAIESGEKLELPEKFRI